MHEAESSATAAALPGRSCPIGYHYGPAVFRRDADLAAESLYVIGGLYGNRYALDAIEAMARQESRCGTMPRLVFNGDFHWFDVAPRTFDEIDARVATHVAMRGNVETELASDDDSGCGCGYPDDVSEETVDRSNRIMTLLRATARQSPDACKALAQLPMHLVARVGNTRIGIVHGDADELAGWRFSRERLRDPAAAQALASCFRDADVDVFASTHTCLPAMHHLLIDGRRRLVVNNGAAGMPNFSGGCCGVVTRIALTSAPAGLPVLHETALLAGDVPVHVAALAVRYDDSSWRTEFRRAWPVGSPAFESYWGRLSNGPAYRVEDAYPPWNASAV